MNEVAYEIALEDAKEYSLEVMKRGCCPSVIKAVFYEENKKCNVRADVHGLFHLKTFLSGFGHKKERFEPSSSLHKEVLRWLRKMVEALIVANEYLIAEDALSFLFEDLYFKSRQGCAVFLLKPSGGSCFEKLCRVCEEIFEICPESNADAIKAQLQLQYANTLPSLHDILRLLSSWECEIC